MHSHDSYQPAACNLRQPKAGAARIAVRPVIHPSYTCAAALPLCYTMSYHDDRAVLRQSMVPVPAYGFERSRETRRALPQEDRCHRYRIASGRESGHSKDTFTPPVRKLGF